MNDEKARKLASFVIFETDNGHRERRAVSVNIKRVQNRFLLRQFGKDWSTATSGKVPIRFFIKALEQTIPSALPDALSVTTAFAERASVIFSQ